jgi:non-ribosomal peptide synthetase-like protein
MVDPVAQPRGSRAGLMTDTESVFADVLAHIVGVQSVSVDSNFFDQLGADSMVMAQFCRRVRKRADLPSVSMEDIYRNPTIRSLATALADTAPTPVDSPVPAPIEAPSQAGTGQYLLCGALQFLILLGYLYVVALVTSWGFEWISEGSGPADGYLRSVLLAGAIFLGLSTVPIVAKWVLIGRWKPQDIPVWSLPYVRFWVVKTLIRMNPLILFLVGSPLYTLYLRALGAKIGRSVAIFSKYVPVCTDLLTIGDGTVIRKDTSISCYRAHAGVIQTGAVTLGKDVFVGEAAVLDIETSLGDGAQLGHRSSPHPGQAVPAGERWHGSPALRTEVDYRLVDKTHLSTPRRAVYGALTLLHVLVVTLPLGIGGIAVLLAQFPEISALLEPGPLAFARWSFYRDALTISAALFFGAVLGLSPVRLPLLGPPDDHAYDEHQVVRNSLR